MKAKIARFLFAFAAPPLIGALMLGIVDLASSIGREDFVELLITFPGTFIEAIPILYIVMGIQSFFYACFMEWIVIPYVKSRSNFILMSSLFGALAGATTLVVFSNFLIIGIGAITGLITGLCLYRLRDKDPAHA